MKRVLILLLLLIAAINIGNAQTTGQKIGYLIDSLSWNSITMNCMGGMLVITHEDTTEQQLLRIGKGASKALVAALDDKTKTVIAHIILTEMWDSENMQHFLSTKYIYKDCNNLIGWHQIYNGLVWEWLERSNMSIEQSEINKIKLYWASKINSKDPGFIIDEKMIFEQLDQLDEDRYPCKKVYENNSGNVKSEDLFNVLNEKADDPVFQKLWTIFGNDSTISIFKDCFFINYGPEGLSFRFEQDSLLSAIFIEPSYKGKLPYKLKLTDKKEDIERKIGLPELSGYRIKDWSYYKEKKLYFYYKETGEISQFYISGKTK